MVTRADLSGTRPLNAVDIALPIRTATDAYVEVTGRLNQIAVGKQVQAEVLSHLAGGTFLVRIDGTEARVNLPATTRIGDQLSMTMLSTTPRPTFLLGAAVAKETASVSQAGRLLDTILQQAQLRGSGTEITGTDPLLPSPPLANGMNVSLLAARLQESIANSGLFYESHLQQWVTGQLPLQRLAGEPQHAYSPPAASDGGQQLAGQQPTDADTLLPPHAAGADMEGLSADAMQMIHRQIHTLEQRQLSWQGECWPGQSMRLEIEDQGTAHSDPSTSDNTGNSWMTTVRFSLPQLGQVHARIRLTGEHVQMQIGVADETVARTLRAHSPALSLSLAAAGTTLDSLLVAKDEQR